MITITILNVIVVLLAYLAKSKNYHYLLALAFILLTVILGVRYNYGNDYQSYNYFFNTGYPWSGDTDDIEIGWGIINRLFKPLGFPFFVFTLTALEHFILYDLIRRHVPRQYYWLAVFLYVFNPYYMLLGLSMMRQFLVQIIGLYAIDKLSQKKIIFFIILILLGSLIHKVSFLLLPLFIIPFLKIPKWWMWVILPIGLYFVMMNMWTILEHSAVFIQDSGMKYADSYLNYNEIGNKSALGLKTILHYVIILFILFRNLSKVDVSGSSFSWMIIPGVFVISFAVIFPFALRISWIYTFSEILCVPILLAKEKNYILKYSLIVILCMTILFFEYRSFWGSEVYGEFYRCFRTIL